MHYTSELLKWLQGKLIPKVEVQQTGSIVRDDLNPSNGDTEVIFSPERTADIKNLVIRYEVDATDVGNDLEINVFSGSINFRNRFLRFYAESDDNRISVLFDQLQFGEVATPDFITTSKELTEYIRNTIFASSDQNLIFEFINDTGGTVTNQEVEVFYEEV